jgi:dienelactone hydrolase
MSRRILHLFLPVFLSLTCSALSAPHPRVVNLKVSDSTLLKATFFAAAKPGPGVLLLHQCNGQRKLWDPLGHALASAGINVLTLDYRGFGESGGTPFTALTPDQLNKVTKEVWPGDIDTAFQYLLAQPGVEHDKIGAGGASCGVHNAILLARRHPEVRALMLLSGPTDRDGRLFLHSSGLPLFTSAALDDTFGNLADTMQWFLSVSPNPASRFQLYMSGGHGAEMFVPHPELPKLIAQWFQAVFSNQPGKVPPTNGAPLPALQVQTLDLIDQPGGAVKAAEMLAAARQRDPNAVLFPEFAVNLLGYEHMQLGDKKGAVEILKLNAAAYPDSPNVYDSLADAYLADGQEDLARTNANKALDLLATDATDSDERKKAIRESAEGKLRQLGPEKSH